MPRDEEESARAFCNGVLGLEEIDKPATLSGRGGVWFKIPNGGEIHYGVEDEFTAAKQAQPALTTKILDEVATKLSAAGYPIVWDDALLPRRRFYTADPFGNRIEILDEVP